MYEVGCYGDCSFGPNHITERIFSIALDEGWNPTGDEWVIDMVFEGEIGSIAPEVIHSMEDDAIDYLNARCSKEGFSWGFDNGDFGYWEQRE